MSNNTDPEKDPQIVNICPLSLPGHSTKIQDIFY